jgi:hypothetical protein
LDSKAYFEWKINDKIHLGWPLLLAVVDWLKVPLFMLGVCLGSLTEGNPKISSSVSISSIAELGICQSILTASLPLPFKGSGFSLFWGGKSCAAYFYSSN